MPDDPVSRPVPEPARGYGTCKAAGVFRHSSLAKEDPDRNASSGLPDGTRRNRLVFPTSTYALMSDPTLSARCDGSQPLLGTPPILHRRGSPIKEIPRHGEPDFLVPFTAVRSLCRLWHFPGSVGLLPIGFHNYCRKNNINVSSGSEMCMDPEVFI